MSTTTHPSPDRLAAATAQLRALESEIAGAVLGQPSVIRDVVVALAAAGHVLLEGMPGIGKTLLVRALAQAVGGRYARIQFTPDLMPADVTGHAVLDMPSNSFRIRRGPIFCNLLLGDEINRAPAKTQSAMLEAMQEQQVTIEGRALDESVLDFAVRLVRANRDWNGVETGAGPRAARGNALLTGNGYVTPDDVKAMACPVLRHRIKLGADLEIEGVTADQLLSEIISNVPAPRR